MCLCVRFVFVCVCVVLTIFEYLKTIFVPQLEKPGKCITRIASHITFMHIYSDMKLLILTGPSVC